MKILSPDGAPAPMAPTETKKAHDPVETKRHEDNLNRLFMELMTGFVEEMTPKQDSTGSVVRDVNKVKEHYAERWASQARILNATGFPHTVPEDRIAREIDGLIAERARQTRRDMPLCKHQDLAEYELLPLLRTRYGMLHINTVCAVAVHDGGMTHVWLRHVDETLEEWVDDWAPVPLRPAILREGELSAARLFQLVAAAGLVRIEPLTEELMMAARTPNRKPWYRFW